MDYSSKDTVADSIKNSPVIVFSKTWCPYCQEAKQILTSGEVQFEAVELDTISNGDQIQKYL